LILGKVTTANSSKT